ncbi:tol-pal system YbgF family protein [Thermodesulfobacteriota bacterium]
MKVRFLVLLLGLALALSCCSGNKAEELFETAKLEELQNAPDHAMKLYQEILDKYPKSEYAQKAKERLSALKVTNWDF